MHKDMLNNLFAQRL